MIKILRNVILSLCMIIFVYIFTLLFGRENILIAISTIIYIRLIFYSEIKGNFFTGFIKLSIFNMILGLAAFASTISIILAIPISLLIVYLIGHSFFDKIYKYMDFPFILNYVFMLQVPVREDKILLRLLALLVSSIIIFIIKYISRKEYLLISENFILREICRLLDKKISVIEKRGNYSNCNKKINCLLVKFREFMYINQDFYPLSNKRRRQKFNFSMELDRLNYNLENKDKFIENKERLKEITSEINIYIKNEKIIKKEILSKKLKLPNYLMFKNIFRKDEKFNEEEKFFYALRVALGITFGIFIWFLFELNFGVWLVCCIYFFGQPKYEISSKIRNGKVANIVISVIILSLIYMLFNNIIVRAIFIILAGYCSFNSNKYSFRIISYNVFILGAPSILSTEELISIERFLIIAIAYVISGLLNRFFLEIKKEEFNERLLLMYNNLLELIINEKHIILDGKIESNESANLPVYILLATLIENRLLISNEGENNNIIEYIREKHQLILETNYLCSYSQEKDYDSSDIENISNLIEGNTNISINIIIREQYI